MPCITVDWCQPDGFPMSGGLSALYHAQHCTKALNENTVDTSTNIQTMNWNPEITGWSTSYSTCDALRMDEVVQRVSDWLRGDVSLPVIWLDISFRMNVQESIR